MCTLTRVVGKLVSLVQWVGFFLRSTLYALNTNLSAANELGGVILLATITRPLFFLVPQLVKEMSKCKRFLGDA